MASLPQCPHFVSDDLFITINMAPGGASPWLSGKESACNAEAAGDVSSILGSGRSLGGGHGNPLQDSCLEYPMDRGDLWATVHGFLKSRT